jgi:hypothetical protein
LLLVIPYISVMIFSSPTTRGAAQYFFTSASAMPAEASDFEIEVPGVSGRRPVRAMVEPDL